MADIELKVVLEDNVIGHQSAIHDVQDDSGAVTISDVDTWHEYTNNGGQYEVKSDGDLWNTTTNIVDVSNRVLYAKIDFILKTTVESASANVMLHVEAYIPDPVGDIHVGGQSVFPAKQNVAHQETITFAGYVGQKMIDYGVKFRTKVDATLSGTITLSERKLLIRI